MLLSNVILRLNDHYILFVNYYCAIHKQLESTGLNCLPVN